jgi:hypothetical protein
VLAFATYAALLSLFSVQDIDTKWFS